MELEIINMAGSIVYRDKCPNCLEFNLSANMRFHCTVCGKDYKLSKVDNERKIAETNNVRKIFSENVKKEIINNQENKCYWCGRLEEI